MTKHVELHCTPQVDGDALTAEARDAVSNRLKPRMAAGDFFNLLTGRGPYT